MSQWHRNNVIHFLKCSHSNFPNLKRTRYSKSKLQEILYSTFIKCICLIKSTTATTISIYLHIFVIHRFFDSLCLVTESSNIPRLRLPLYLFCHTKLLSVSFDFYVYVFILFCFCLYVLSNKLLFFHIKILMCIVGLRLFQWNIIHVRP